MEPHDLFTAAMRLATQGLNELSPSARQALSQQLDAGAALEVTFSLRDSVRTVFVHAASIDGARVEIGRIALDERAAH